MYSDTNSKEVRVLEHALKTRHRDFEGTYLAVGDLQELVLTNPGAIRPQTVCSLKNVLENSRFLSQTQAYFLYRKTAGTLAAMVMHASVETKDQGHSSRLAQETAEAAYKCTATSKQRLPVASQSVALQALLALKDVLGKVNGAAQRGTAEALGSLPVSVKGPEINKEWTRDIPDIEWEKLLEECNVGNGRPPAVIGRCLVLDLQDINSRLVVKLACGEQTVHNIHTEAIWMEHLRSGDYAFPERFNIPRAMKFKGSYVVRLRRVPGGLPEAESLHPNAYAICFIAHKDYFSYANQSDPEGPLSKETFKDVMLRNAWLLGRLTFMGIVHSAPIPLFHNRLQADRRTDHGLYEWQRGGRLDRWLASCSYPNFGVSGIRDFEHLIAFDGSARELYQHIGAQLISLLLVAGSYFRNIDAERVGLDANGAPIDARDLFDRQLLEEVVRGIFWRYYHGFAGTEFDGCAPFDLDVLCSRMIEEMGVDRYMEEILRVVDQERMSDEEFRGFLIERGYPEKEAKQLRKGAEDITLLTGPHLGSFNDTISLPELIDSAGGMAALCVVGRYLQESLPSSPFTPYPLSDN